jgi:hypothetical protein
MPLDGLQSIAAYSGAITNQHEEAQGAVSVYLTAIMEIIYYWAMLTIPEALPFAMHITDL